MLSERGAKIAARFGGSAGIYDRHASLQARVARRLGALLPASRAPRVLEIGCGTGFFTQHLLRRYPDGDFLITDIAPEMLAICRQRVTINGRALHFALLDGEVDAANGVQLAAARESEPHVEIPDLENAHASRFGTGLRLKRRTDRWPTLRRGFSESSSD